MSSYYHYLREIVRNALLTMLENKRRTLLTTLGIVIGVSAVIIINGIGAGAQGLIVGQVKKLGSNLLGVLPGKSESNGPPATAMGISITTLTYEDAMAVKDKRNVPNVIGVVPYSRGSATVSWRGVQTEASLSGCSVDYIAVEGGEVETGRFFSEIEDRDLARVAVLGSAVKSEIFGDNDPIGQNIKIKNQTFEVIGVMTERGQVAFQNYDEYVFLPINTMQHLIAGVRYIGLMRVKIDDEKNTEAAINDIILTLRERHDITDKTGASDDFSVRSAAQALDIITSITDALRYFLAGMAALSLLVGGIGIMNIMLIRVAQRTREIGLRKAVGATNNDIKLHFLVESIMITLVGGLIGIIIGETVSWLIAIVAQYLGYDWPFTILPLTILLAVGVSMAVGLLFGLYPAVKASKLSPMEALRYE